MAKSVFSGIRVRGIAAAVPEHRVINAADHRFVAPEDREKVITLTGVQEYRRADADTCSSDLCQQAAEQLLDGTDINASDIDAILFVSMTPDYRIPSTACLLQDRLGAGNSTLAFDINMGCSGYVVGLYNACSLLAGGGLNTVLLLAGDTQTKLCYENDKNVAFILADAGTATLLQKDDAAEPITIELNTDGGGYENLYIPAGGFRRMSDERSREVQLREDGGLRADDHLFMNGMEIFKFSSTEVVDSLGNFMQDQALTPEGVDNLFLHQANRFMNDKIATKLKFPKDKVPYSITHFGNTGSASIPMTITHHFSKQAQPANGRQLLCGFGVGLSWGMVDIQFDDVYVPPISEYRSGNAPSRTAGAGGDAVMLFPGQGAQYVGMGREVYEEHAAARDVFARASDHLGTDFKALCFDGPDAELVKTENAQPAVTVVNIACFEALRSRGISPLAAGGHSLGEYAALYAGGVLSFEDVLTLVSERGRLMQVAAGKNPGGMLAVLGSTQADVEEMIANAGLDADVELANINSPTETILTGGKAALDAMIAVAEQHGAAKVLPLHVSGPWHSRFMQPAGEQLDAVIADVDISAPSIPVVCNVTGKIYESADEIRRRLVEQVSAPVQWIECQRSLLAASPGARIIEVGPGNTLARLLQAIQPDAPVSAFGQVQ